MCNGTDDGFSWGGNVQEIVDGDGEKAKKCLDCGKTFYSRDECPFCTVMLEHCQNQICGKIRYNNKWVFPLEAVTGGLNVNNEKKIKHIYTMCDECKAEDLCKTRPIAVCTER